MEVILWAEVVEPAAEEEAAAPLAAAVAVQPDEWAAASEVPEAGAVIPAEEALAARADFGHPRRPRAGAAVPACSQAMCSDG